MPHASIVVRPGRRRLGWGFAIGLCAFLATASYRFFASFPVSRNADDASNFLAGMEMVHGNWLLHGWRLAPDNFAPTDILAQGLATVLLGNRPVLIDVVEAMIWAAAAMVAASLAIRGIPGRTRLPAAMVTVSLVIFGCQYADPHNGALTGVGSHGSSILLILLAFRSAAGIEQSGSQRLAARSAGLIAWVAIGSFADPLFSILGALPLLVTCGLQWRRGRRHRPALLIAGSVITGILLSRILLAIVHVAGGFGSDSFPVAFAPLAAVLRHGTVAAGSISNLFGAAPSGPVLFMLRFGFVLALVLVLVQGAAGLVRTLATWRKPGTAGGTGFLDQLLWISMIGCLTGSLLTTVMVDYSCIRFFLPVLAAGSILIVRRLWAVRAFAAYASLLAAFSIISAVAPIILHPPRWPTLASPGSWRLVAALRQAGLHHGYGGYWDSSLTTMLTRGDVQTLALAEPLPGAIQPYPWFANLDWYRDAAANWRGRVFFITSAHPGSTLKLNQTTIVDRFGTAAQIIQVDDTLIEVYDLRPGMLLGLKPPE